MHRLYVEELVAAEEQAIRADERLVGTLLRLDRRGVVLVAELRQVVYNHARQGQFGPVVPLLGQRRDRILVARLHCDNYDTDPPAFSFVTDWSADQELPFSAWPKGPGIVERHHLTGRPFLCKPGVREFHRHFQHGDESWEKYRGLLRPREVLQQLAADLASKQIFV